MSLDVDSRHGTSRPFPSMKEPPQKPRATKSMPMTEWLSLMLAEIERKEAEASAANAERKRRETGEDDSADVT
jgi:hypothetical protein